MVAEGPDGVCFKSDKEKSENRDTPSKNVGVESGNDNVAMSVSKKTAEDKGADSGLACSVGAEGTASVLKENSGSGAHEPPKEPPTVSPRDVPKCISEAGEKGDNDKRGLEEMLSTDGTPGLSLGMADPQMKVDHVKRAVVKKSYVEGSEDVSMNPVELRKTSEEGNFESEKEGLVDVSEDIATVPTMTGKRAVVDKRGNEEEAPLSGALSGAFGGVVVPAEHPVISEAGNSVDNKEVLVDGDSEGAFTASTEPRERSALDKRGVEKSAGHASDGFVVSVKHQGDLVLAKGGDGKSQVTGGSHDVVMTSSEFEGNPEAVSPSGKRESGNSPGVAKVTTASPKCPESEKWGGEEDVVVGDSQDVVMGTPDSKLGDVAEAVPRSAKRASDCSTGVAVVTTTNLKNSEPEKCSGEKDLIVGNSQDVVMETADSKLEHNAEIVSRSGERASDGSAGVAAVAIAGLKNSDPEKCMGDSQDDVMGTANSKLEDNAEAATRSGERVSEVSIDVGVVATTFRKSAEPGIGNKKNDSPVDATQDVPPVAAQTNSRSETVSRGSDVNSLDREDVVMGAKEPPANRGSQRSGEDRALPVDDSSGVPVVRSDSDKSQEPLGPEKEKDVPEDGSRDVPVPTDELRNGSKAQTQVANDVAGKSVGEEAKVLTSEAQSSATVFLVRRKWQMSTCVHFFATFGDSLPLSVVAPSTAAALTPCLLESAVADPSADMLNAVVFRDVVASLLVALKEVHARTAQDRWFIVLCRLVRARAAEFPDCFAGVPELGGDSVPSPEGAVSSLSGHTDVCCLLDGFSDGIDFVRESKWTCRLGILQSLCDIAAEEADCVREMLKEAERLCSTTRLEIEARHYRLVPLGRCSGKRFYFCVAGSRIYSGMKRKGSGAVSVECSDADSMSKLILRLQASETPRDVALGRKIQSWYLGPLRENEERKKTKIDRELAMEAQKEENRRRNAERPRRAVAACVE